jgi:nucleoside phosphorylase
VLVLALAVTVLGSSAESSDSQWLRAESAELEKDARLLSPSNPVAPPRAPSSSKTLFADQPGLGYEPRKPIVRSKDRPDICPWPIETQVPASDEVSSEDSALVETILCQVQVLMVTVTDVEWISVAMRLRPLPGRERLLKSTLGRDTYHVGVLGLYAVALVQQTNMGGGGIGGAYLTVQAAINLFKPKAVIMVGVAFGMQPEAQRYGDVLVAKSIMAYDMQRIGTNRFYTGSSNDSPLVDMFLQSTRPGEWSFPPARVQIGQMISGSKLVDNQKYADRLRKSFPAAIGGDMEGYAVADTCIRNAVAWGFVKSVVDFGGLAGAKAKGWQPFGASAAASFVTHALSRDVLGKFGARTIHQNEC